MAQRLRYASRVETIERPADSSWVPWLLKAPRVHVEELVFDKPLAADVVEAVGERLRERTPFEVWGRVGGAWRQLQSLARDSDDARVERVAFFVTILGELMSDSWRAELERDREADRAYEQEAGLPAPAPRFDSMEACLTAWRAELGVPCETVSTGSRAALAAEVARLRAFCPFEFRDGFPEFTLRLTPLSGDAAPDDEAVSSALFALGYRKAGEGFRFDPPLGVWENGVEAWIRDGVCSLSVALTSEMGPAVQDILDLMLRSAAELEAALNLKARCDLQSDRDLETIRAGATKMVALLEQDGFFGPGTLLPDVDVAGLEELANEKHDLLSSKDLRAAGRTLTVQLKPAGGKATLWLVGAVVATVAAIFWPWAALAVVGCLALAALSSRRAPIDVELDLAELRLTTRGELQRHRLPLAIPMLHGQPVKDAEGRVVPLPPHGVTAGYQPDSMRTVHDALFIRNALARRTVSLADRVALETLYWATSKEPGWARGRRPGYVAVAIGEAGGLAFFEDQESLSAWKPNAPPHRLGFVRITDQSGKGASVGYPSEVEWGAPLKLNLRDRLFLEEG